MCVLGVEGREGSLERLIVETEEQLVQRQGRKRDSDFKPQEEREREDLFASQKIDKGTCAYH